MKPQTTTDFKSDKSFQDTCEKYQKVIEKIYDSNLEHVLDVYLQNKIHAKRMSTSGLKTFHRLYLEEKKSVKKICSQHRTPQKKAKKNMLIFLGVLGMLLTDFQSCSFKEDKTEEKHFYISNSLKEVDATEEPLRAPKSLEQEKNGKLKSSWRSVDVYSDFGVFYSRQVWF